MTICKRRLIISFILAIIVSYLYFNEYLNNIKEVLSNLILFSASLLILVHIHFYLFKDIIKSKLYQKIKKNFSKAILELNNLVESSITLNISLIIFCFLGITLHFQINFILKILLCFLGSYIFFLMMITNISVFLIILYLYGISRDN